MDVEIGHVVIPNGIFSLPITFSLFNPLIAYLYIHIYIYNIEHIAYTLFRLIVVDINKHNL